MDIHVFKTNISNTNHLSDLEKLLDIHPNIIQWNVDLKDCDKVLRIVSKNVAATDIENLVLGAGIFCEELL